MRLQRERQAERTDYIQGFAGSLARIKRTAGVDAVTFLHADWCIFWFPKIARLGTARAGSDTTGAQLWEAFHTPFGESLISPAANDNQADYTGHIRDSGSGLTYMQARYQDPVIGRFLSIDPVTFMDTGDTNQFNRYMYGNNDPINMFDPDGEDTVGLAIRFKYTKIFGATGKLDISIDTKSLRPSLSFTAGAHFGVGAKGQIAVYHQPGETRTTPDLKVTGKAIAQAEGSLSLATLSRIGGGKPLPGEITAGGDAWASGTFSAADAVEGGSFTEGLSGDVGADLDFSVGLENVGQSVSDGRTEYSVGGSAFATVGAEVEIELDF